MVRPGGDAGVVRLTPSRRAIAISLDGNGRRTWLDPRRGGAAAVCEAARNVACTGARPAAVTNCLNFGNPETGEVGYELARGDRGHVAGLRGARACRSSRATCRSTTSTSGSPSTRRRWSASSACWPTPSWPSRPASRARVTWCCWPATARPPWTAPSTRSWCWARWPGASPLPTWWPSARLHRFLAEAAERRLLRSAHDVADGGLAVTLAESAIAGGIGVGCRLRPALLGEGDGRVVISVARAGRRGAARRWPASCRCGGSARVGGDAIVLSGQALPLAEAAGIYESALPAAVEGSG